ncbi:type II toxin-antitoxin system VapC family toxin [Candidatus Micrarchaeota archaeon]|nr:type II toxin-antitoxin system VapC family toxin [Candidatus Micrarchaeota archaeon]
MILDSSFLIALFLEEDALHEKATEQLASLPKNEPLTAPSSVMEETMNILTYRRGVSFAMNALSELEENKCVYTYFLEKTEWNTVINLMKAISKKMSFTDYFVIYLARKTGEKTLSFDNQLNNTI